MRPLRVEAFQEFDEIRTRVTTEMVCLLSRVPLPRHENGVDPRPGRASRRGRFALPCPGCGPLAPLWRGSCGLES